MTKPNTPADRSVLAVGYIPLDIVSYQQRVWHAAGGTAGNVAAILAFLGWKASVAAELGDDHAGKRLRRDLQKANVSVEHVRLGADRETPRLVHRITERGHHYRFRCPSCARSFPMSRPLRRDRATELSEELPVPSVFFVDRLNAGTLLLAEHFHQKGSTIVFEPSRPARADLTQRMVAIAALVKAAADRVSDESLFSSPPSGQVQVLTDGSNGARYRVGDRPWHSSPAFAYPVIDAGGAGDWTTAGLVHSIDLTERTKVGDVGDGLRWAQALAAVSCGAPGARGLARQQTAETVLRAATFLQQRQPNDYKAADSTWADAPEIDAACRWCLLPSPSAHKARRGGGTSERTAGRSLDDGAAVS